MAMPDVVRGRPEPWHDDTVPNPGREDAGASRPRQSAPAEQAALWDGAELARLGRLRKLAADSDAPEDVIRVIELPAGPEPPAATAAASKPRKRAGRKNIHRIKVTLRGSKPPIWRRFEVPSDITLKRLHDVIQRGFGWQDRHLFVFETEIGRYSVPDPDSNGPDPDFRNAASKKLSAVADWPGDRILYVYDFGDAWEHDILVEAVMPAGPGVDYPRCTAGRRAGAPEDCGGPSGYRELLNVLANQRSPQHAAMLQSLGIESAADFDPEYFSAAHVNAELSYMSKVLVWH